MKKYIVTAISVGLLVLIVLTGAATVDRSTTAPIEGAVNWMTFEEALEASKTEKRKVFVDVYTDWCGWCKVMDKKTFNDPEVASLLNTKFFPVKFNAEQEEDIIFREHTFKYIAQGNRGYHELAAALLQNKLSYPTVVFLDEEFNLIQPLPGYREAKEFHPILEFFADDDYKTMKWDQFQEEYTSPYN